MFFQLHLLLFLSSTSLSQTPPSGGNVTSGEDLDVETLDEETVEIGDDIPESENEMVIDQKDGEGITSDPVGAFEASQKALSEAWKELGDAEVAAEEVKRRVAKWQERSLTPSSIKRQFFKTCFLPPGTATDSTCLCLG